jgi:tRNA pseudouridine55 synthase
MMMDGFLIIDKSPGMTSFQVVKTLKKICAFKKIGYIGTLDRNAGGILPVAMNEGVKLIPFLENSQKRYSAKIVLGVTTDTLDLDGTVTCRTEPPFFDESTIRQVLSSFQGKIIQKIPMYSSKKIEGKRLYELARKGVSIESPTKEVEVHKITFLNYTHPYIDVDITCSKGTYIRVIANDVGRILGCGAALHSLKRTQHGDFTLDRSTVLEYLHMKQDVVKYLLSLNDVLSGFKELAVEPAVEKFLKNGMPVPLPGDSKEWKHDEYVKLTNKSKRLIGIGRVDTITKTVRTKRLING